MRNHRWIFCICALGLLVAGCMMWPFADDTPKVEADNAYAFTFKTLVGGDSLPLRQYEGKVLMIVNTASECGFTKQYEGLEKLYETYKDRGLVIVGVPSNDFGGQEPGSSEEIAHFCKLNYGVTFPMANKEEVTGDQRHPFYAWASQTLGFGTAPKWNFHKYLIDRHGKLVNYYNSNTSPESGRVTEAIEQLLEAP